MPKNWIDRTTRGPSLEFMRRDEFCTALGISEETLALYHAHGILPEPIRPTRRTVHYTWEHAVMLSLWMRLGGRICESTPNPCEPKPKLAALAPLLACLDPMFAVLPLV